MTFLLFRKKSSAASGGGVLRRYHANRASEFAARAGLFVCTSLRPAAGSRRASPAPLWGTLGSSPRASVSPKPPLFFRAWGWRQRRNSTADANRSMILPGPACPLYDEYKSHQRSAPALDVTRLGPPLTVANESRPCCFAANAFSEVGASPVFDFANSANMSRKR